MDCYQLTYWVFVVVVVVVDYPALHYTAGLSMQWKSAFSRNGHDSELKIPTPEIERMEISVIEDIKAGFHVIATKKIVTNFAMPPTIAAKNLIVEIIWHRRALY